MVPDVDCLRRDESTVLIGWVSGMSLVKFDGKAIEKDFELEFDGRVSRLLAVESGSDKLGKGEGETIDKRDLKVSFFWLL